MNEAELLFTEVLGCDRASLYLGRHAPLGRVVSQRIAQTLKQRMRAEPLQYILGKAFFYGMEFSVTPDVLIPRPETELVVERSVQCAQLHLASQSRISVLDIGTGSGCIAIALAAAVPQAHVTAVDISSSALAVAAKNTVLHAVAQRVSLCALDFLQDADALPAHGFSVVVSNPPYICDGDIASLQPEVQYEPRRALSGGEDGLLFYRVIARTAGRLLVPGGDLVLEVGAGQAPDVAALLEAHQMRVCSVEKDYNGIARVITAKAR